MKRTLLGAGVAGSINPLLTGLSAQRTADAILEGQAGQTQHKHRHSKEQSQ